jgi:iron complex transport system ATP-binding protein
VTTPTSAAHFSGAPKAIALAEVSIELGGARVVDSVSAVVEEGEWVALIGPNGAGKTTLLRAIAGLVPAQGRIEVAGEPAGALGRRRLARRVALVPQTPLMPPEMTVAEYVLLGRTPHLGYLGGEGRSDLEAADRALARLDLSRFAGRRLSTLSGGERQRAVLARALAQEAPLLLLDEPTSSLDIGRGQQALELVDALRRDGGLTVLSAMHDLTLAAQYADRLLLLDCGRLAAGGPPAEVLRPELIAEHYGAEVRVLVNGGVAVVPSRPPR